MTATKGAPWWVWGSRAGGAGVVPKNAGVLAQPRSPRPPPEVTAADLVSLQAHGLSKDDIWDVGAIVAFFALSNRLAHWAAIPPNEEFFLMGRLPRD